MQRGWGCGLGCCEVLEARSRRRGRGAKGQISAPRRRFKRACIQYQGSRQAGRLSRRPIFEDLQSTRLHKDEEAGIPEGRTSRLLSASFGSGIKQVSVRPWSGSVVLTLAGGDTFSTCRIGGQTAASSFPETSLFLVRRKRVPEAEATCKSHVFRCSGWAASSTAQAGSVTRR